MAAEQPERLISRREISELLDGQFTKRQIGYHEKAWGLDKYRIKIGFRHFYRRAETQEILRSMGAKV
jgi:hypothetical protein